jgi:hypothetical protein
VILIYFAGVLSLEDLFGVVWEVWVPRLSDQPGIASADFSWTTGVAVGRPCGGALPRADLLPSALLMHALVPQSRSNFGQRLFIVSTFSSFTPKGAALEFFLFIVGGGGCKDKNDPKT